MSSYDKIEKPWGYEQLLEKNDRYILKKLFMKKDAMCSLQYHNKKHETIYVLSGILGISIEKEKVPVEEKVLLPNDFLAIAPLTIHRMCGIDDCLYLESSTPELYDVVRLNDLYGRK